MIVGKPPSIDSLVAVHHESACRSHSRSDQLIAEENLIFAAPLANSSGDKSVCKSIEAKAVKIIRTQVVIDSLEAQ